MTHPTPAPPSPEIQLHWAGLHRAGYQEQPNFAYLLDSLLHPDPAIWSYGQRVLRRILPLASLYERWPQEQPESIAMDSALPHWLNQGAADWWTPNGFPAICARKLIASEPAERQLLIARLLPLYGAGSQITAQLTQQGRPELANDYHRQVNTSLAHQFPRQLTLIPTMACQLQCRYCYSAGVHQNATNTMSKAVLLHHLDWARDSAIRRLCLAGGEPTLYHHLDSLLAYSQQHNMEYFLSSNGLYTSEVAEMLEQIPPLSVSLHINPEIFATQRKTRFMNNARRLAASGIMTALRFNLTSATATEYWPYLDLCQELGIHQIRLAVPVPNLSRSNSYAQLTLKELHEYGATIDRFVAATRKYQLEVHLSKPFPPCLLAEETAAIFLENGSYNACCQVHLQHNSHNLTVYPDGHFSPCLSLNAPSVKPITSYPDIIQAAASYAPTLVTLSSRPLMRRCQKCPLSLGGRCLGGCLSYRADLPEHSGHSAIQ